jgi:hypothetical protein
MDAGIALKPLVNVHGANAQPAPDVARAAPSILPPDKTVRPLVNASASRNETRRQEEREPPPAKKLTHDTIIDPETREVVYRVLDARTRQVMHQEPDQAVLRQQAYARVKIICALAAGKNPNGSALSAANTIKA